MEKENLTLKIRIQHKEQTLKRFQQFVEEIRLEQLAMIDQHSREQLNLQETILEQQRTLHRSNNFHWITIAKCFVKKGESKYGKGGCRRRLEGRVTEPNGRTLS